MDCGVEILSLSGPLAPNHVTLITHPWLLLKPYGEGFKSEKHRAIEHRAAVAIVDVFLRGRFAGEPDLLLGLPLRLLTVCSCLLPIRAHSRVDVDAYDRAQSIRHAARRSRLLLIRF